MPKNPFQAGKIVLKNGGSITNAAGTAIISVSSAGVPTIATTVETVVDLTTTGNTVIGNSASDTLTVTSTLAGKLPLALNGGAASASGLLFGVGTTANPTATATAGANFFEIRAKTTATSGDNRLGYLRYDIGGAGASGEALRAFTDLTAAAGTARGTQISLQVGSTGTVSGLGAGVDAQLYVKDSAVTGGTYTALNAEIYSAGASSSVAAPTDVSFIRVANSGHATGAGTVDAKAVLLDLTGFTSGANSTWYDHQGSAPVNVEEWIKVKTPAGIRWLPLYNAVV